MVSNFMFSGLGVKNTSFLKKLFFYLLIVLTPFFPRILFLEVERGVPLKSDWTCKGEQSGRVLENVSFPSNWFFYGYREKFMSCERTIFFSNSEIAEDYGLFLVNIVIAYEVYWNEVLIEKKGNFTETQEEFDPSPNLVVIKKENLKEGENHLKILIYDPNGAGGFFKIPIFGKLNNLKKEVFINLLKFGGIIFLCFFTFVLYLFYYLNNPTQKEVFYFAILCLTIGVNAAGYYKISYFISNNFVFNYLLYNLSLCFLGSFLILFISATFEKPLSTYSWFLLGVVLLYFIITLLGGFSESVRNFQRYYLLGAFVIFIPLFGSIELIRHIINKKNIFLYETDYLVLASFVSFLTLNHAYLRFFIDIFPNEELTVESFLTFLIGMIMTISQKQKYVQEKLDKVEKNYQENLKRDIQEKTYELAILNEKLQKDHDFKDKLFSILAHDLRSPLNSLELLIDLVKEEEINNEEFQEHIKDISLSLSNTQFILGTLLFWVSEQVKKRNIFLEVFSPIQVFEETILILSQQIIQKNIEIKKEFESECLVYTDRNMIRIVLRNLLSNAIKFSTPNSKLILGYKVNGQDCELFIQDFGVGMDEETQKIILDKTTSQVNSQRGTQNEKGLGLGLKLSFEFLKELGSEIFLTSQKDKGSKFWFRVPLAKELYDTYN